MFHRVIFCRITETAGIGIHFYQGILIPPPGAGAAFGQEEIPIEPLATTDAHIVGYEEKSVLPCLPVHGAVATFAFRADIGIVGILTADGGQDLSSLPLEGQAADAAAQSLIAQDLLHMILAVGVESAQIEPHIRMVFPKRGSQVVAVETDCPLGRPGTTRIRRIAVSLVLIDHHIDGYALLFVGIDELTEIIGICLQVTRILDEVVLCGQTAGELLLAFAQEFHLIRIHTLLRTEQQVVQTLVSTVVRTAQHRIVARDLHPAGRAPRRGPEGKGRIELLGSPYQRDNAQLVPLNVKIAQFQVSRHFVAAVPRAGIVIGVHGDASASELQVTVWRKEIVHDFVLFVTGQHQQGIPIQLVKGGSPRPEHGSPLRSLQCQQRLAVRTRLQPHFAPLPRGALSCGDAGVRLCPYA